MMSVTTSLEQAIPENVHTLMEASKEYGIY
jgi:hypothetical protein